MRTPPPPASPERRDARPFSPSTSRGDERVVGAPLPRGEGDARLDRSVGRLRRHAQPTGGGLNAVGSPGTSSSPPARRIRPLDRLGVTTRAVAPTPASPCRPTSTPLPSRLGAPTRGAADMTTTGRTPIVVTTASSPTTRVRATRPTGAWT